MNNDKDYLAKLMLGSKNGESKKERRKRYIPEVHKPNRRILVPIVAKLLLETEYGEESFTDSDIAEIISEYNKATNVIISAENMRHAVRTSRKGGHYKYLNKGIGKNNCGQTAFDSIVKGTPQWYWEYLATPHCHQLKKEMLEYWGSSCLLNCEHSNNIEMHHRRYHDENGSILGRETVKDVIPLCRACHRRHHKFIAQVPFEQTK